MHRHHQLRLLDYRPHPYPTRLERDFDGETFEPARDHDRLARQLDAVADVMADGAWRTLREIATACGAPESSVSARLRDLRKPRFGAHHVERRYQGDGVWAYRVIDREPAA